MCKPECDIKINKLKNTHQRETSELKKAYQREINKLKNAHQRETSELTAIHEQQDQIIKKQDEKIKRLLRREAYHDGPDAP